MYLKEYINKLKHGDFIDEKKWLDQNAILETIIEEMPDSGTEEWKNFKTNSIKETSWKVLLENSIKKIISKKNSANYLIVYFLLTDITVKKLHH